MFCHVTASPGSSYLGNCVLHDLLVRHIALVAYEELVDTLCGISVDLLQPLLDVVEGIHIGDIVNDADAVRAAVVGRGDGSEALLSCGIPLYPYISALLSQVFGGVARWGPYNL